VIVTITSEFPPGGISVTVTITPKFYHMTNKGFLWMATEFRHWFICVYPKDLFSPIYSFH
jgi:hypothetical protein